MTRFLIVGALISTAWYIVSECLAWLIVGRTGQGDHLETRMGMFLLPIIILLMTVAYLHQTYDRFARYCGFPVLPKKNPMEYLP